MEFVAQREDTWSQFFSGLAESVKNMMYTIAYS